MQYRGKNFADGESAHKEQRIFKSKTHEKAIKAAKIAKKGSLLCLSTRSDYHF